MRGWVSRPGRLRVERLDGTVLRAERYKPRYAVFDASALPDTGAGPPPRETEPVWDADGLVARRPRHYVDHDPIHDTYTWAAMLDPVELADGQDHARAGAAAPPAAVTVDDLTVVDHHGRPAWEALVRPTPAYDPMCSCCPLLRSKEADDREAESGGRAVPATSPDFTYPNAHRVRLDVETGVCVDAEAIGGTPAGNGHEVVIEAIDEPMGQELFTPPIRWRLRRRRRR